MKSKSLKKAFILALGSAVSFVAGTVALAASGAADVGIASVAANVTENLANVAKLITAASYVAGMGFGVAAIVKFKAHKDNPTQVTIGMPIALLFVAAALLFIPSVYQTSGGTLFGASGTVGGISGVTGFGAKTASENQ